MAVVFAGMGSGVVGDLPADRIIDLARRTGLDAVEWAHAVAGRSPGRRTAELGRRSRQAGIATPCYATALVAGSEGVDRAAIAAALDTAVELQTPNVRIDTVTVPADPAAGAGWRTKVVADVAAIADRAAGRGLTVTVARREGTVTATAASTVALLDEIGTDNLYTDWQPLAGDDTDLVELDGVAARLSHVRVHAGSDERVAPLDHGAPVLRPALARVQRAFGTWAGARVVFISAVRGAAADQLVADAATLRSWLAAIS